jgi:hypothetical protein
MSSGTLTRREDQMGIGPARKYFPLWPGNSGRPTVVRECTVKGQESPQFSVTRKDGKILAYYWMPWVGTGQGANEVKGTPLPIQQAEMDFIGWSYTSFSPFTGIPRGIYRYPPYPHPTLPKYYAESVNFRGDIPAGVDTEGVSQYDEAFVQVTFASSTVNFGDQGVSDEGQLTQYVDIAVNPTGRYQTVPATAIMSWMGQPWEQAAAGGGVFFGQRNFAVPMSNKELIIIGEAEVEIVWLQIPIPAIPWGGMQASMNAADGPNADNTSYAFGANSYIGPLFVPTALTVRSLPNFICLTPKVSRPYLMSSLDLAVDITYKFKYKPFGANYYYRWQTGTWQEARLAIAAGIPGTLVPGIPPAGPSGGLPFYGPAYFQKNLFWGQNH